MYAAVLQSMNCISAAVIVYCVPGKALGAIVCVLIANVAMQERWRQTSLNKAVNDFNTCFLDSLIADNKSQLTMKARQAVAQPTAVW